MPGCARPPLRVVNRPSCRKCNSGMTDLYRLNQIKTVNSCRRCLPVGIRCWFVLLAGSLAMILSGPARAHTVGDQNWCLLLAPVHQECLYDVASACQKEREQYSTGRKKVTREILEEKFEKKTNPQISENFQLQCIPNFRKRLDSIEEPFRPGDTGRPKQRKPGPESF